MSVGLIGLTMETGGKPRADVVDVDVVASLVPVQAYEHDDEVHCDLASRKVHDGRPSFPFT